MIGYMYVSFLQFGISKYLGTYLPKVNIWSHQVLKYLKYLSVSYGYMWEVLMYLGTYVGVQREMLTDFLLAGPR